MSKALENLSYEQLLEASKQLESKLSETESKLSGTEPRLAEMEFQFEQLKRLYYGYGT